MIDILSMTASPIYVNDSDGPDRYSIRAIKNAARVADAQTNHFEFPHNNMLRYSSVMSQMQSKIKIHVKEVKQMIKRTFF